MRCSSFSWIALAAALSTAACAHSEAPAMTPRAEQALPAPAAGTARVVFTRHASGCDTFDHARIVDEQGNFVGALAPDTAFVADVPPGRHAFFVWPGMDLRVDRNPEFHPVGVIDLELGENTTRTVDVDIVTPRQGRGHCYRYAVFSFQRPRPGAEVAGLRIVEPDAIKGREALLERKELTGAYFTLAQQILESRRAKRAAEERMAEKRRVAGLE